MITEEQHADITGGHCAYCGALPSERPHPYLRGSIISNGIDRIDSSRGYEPDNVASCCSVCNMAKGDMTVSDFRAWVTQVHAHLLQSASG